MRKRLITEEFIEKARLVHGDKYDYSLVEYVRAHSKINIICKEHGVFEQSANSHLNNHGCPKCVSTLRKQEDFIILCKTKHGNKFDYSLVEYISSKEKIKIICPKHGIFTQKAITHSSGSGCPKCYNQNVTTEEFIEKAKLVHGERYDYSLSKYVSSQSKITIICKKHGIFQQQVAGHLNKNGCPKCSILVRAGEEFVDKAKLVHGDKYDYSKVKYTKSTNNVNIICPEHGLFKQFPSNHLRGANCPKCSGSYMDTDYFIEKAKLVHNNKYDYTNVNYINNKIKININCSIHGIFKQSPDKHLMGENCPKCSGSYMDTNYFIEKSNIIHNNKYDYSLVDYKKNNIKIKIICPIHGVFTQTPSSHMSNGNGCSCCNMSKGELAIENYLKNNSITYIHEKTFDDCKNIRKLSYDFHVPDYNLLIEYDGKQHFKPMKFFGGDKPFEQLLINDNIKNEYAKTNNIDLLRIKFTDFKNINKILTNTLQL